MLGTYTIPRASLAEIRAKLEQVDGLSVQLSNEVEGDDEDLEAIFEIGLDSRRYQLPILRPSDAGDPSLFKCWLFSGSDFNPLSPIAWFRWIAVERKQLRDLEQVLENAIGLRPCLSNPP